MKSLTATWFGALAAVGIALASGCADESPTGIVLDDPQNPTGGTTTNPQEGGTAQEYFETQVFPELSANCQDCHSQGNMYGGPEWLDVSSPTEAYNLMKSYPDMVKDPNCALITIYPVSSEHAGPTLGGDILAKVTEWLKREKLEAGGALDCPGEVAPGTPGPLEQCTTALNDFRACMSFAFWEVSGIYDIPNQNSTGGQCYTCHSSCLGNACLPQNSRDFFDAHADSEVNIVKLVRCVIDNNEFLGLAGADRYLNKGNEGTVYSSGETHPSYALQQDRRDGMDMFVSETIQAVNDGTCVELNEQYEQELNQ